MSDTIAGGARGGLGYDQLPRSGARERPGGLGQQRPGRELDRHQRHHESGDGIWSHMNFGGAEAPEQLLPYLQRRLGISTQAGSVYRSVNF